MFESTYPPIPEPRADSTTLRDFGSTLPFLHASSPAAITRRYTSK